MKAKRPLKLREIEVLIYDSEITVRGTLKRRYTAHLGRVSHADGDIIQTGCSVKGTIRWRYYANLHNLATMNICRVCSQNLIKNIDQSELGEWRGEEAPASNTGVNSYEAEAK